jgi:hypothetical protein
MKRLLLVGFCVCIVAVIAGCSVAGSHSNDWIVGTWITKNAYGPHSNVSRYFSNGTWALYNDYSETQQFAGGTWELNGNILSSDGVDFEITKINDNHYTAIILGVTVHNYRKGYEPDGSIFSNPATVLTANDWASDSIDSLEEVDIFTYTAAGDGVHTVEWDDDGDGSGGYTGDIMVTVYASDQLNMFFEEEEDGFHGIEEQNEQPVLLDEGDLIYIIVEQSFLSGSGTYAIRVNEPYSNK